MTETKKDPPMEKENENDGTAMQGNEHRTISRSDYGLRVTGSPEFVGEILRA